MSKHQFIIKHRILFYFLADIEFTILMSLFFFIFCANESFWVFTHFKFTIILLFLWLGLIAAIWTYERICKKYSN